MSELFEPVDDDCYEVEPPTIPMTSEVEALQDAGWHLRQLRHLRKRRADLDALYQREFERIETWYEGQHARLTEKIAWHEAPLRQLSVALQGLDPKRKTIAVPDGKLKLRVSATPKAQIDDADALLEWAREHAPQVITRIEEVKVSDLRRECAATEDGKVILHATGEIVPHASAVVPEPTWSYDVEVGE